MYYTFYFRGGDKKIVTGDEADIAFRKIGGGGLINGVDFYEHGINFDYLWCKETHNWVNHPILEINLFTVVVDGVKFEPFHLEYIKKDKKFATINDFIVYTEKNAIVKVSNLESLFNWKLGIEEIA